MKIFTAIIVCLTIFGCAHALPVDRTKVTLELGMTKQQVLAAMGRPEWREVYKELDGTMREWLIYAKYQRYEDKTPIGFLNNKVIGWGKAFYKDEISKGYLRIK